MGKVAERRGEAEELSNRISKQNYIIDYRWSDDEEKYLSHYEVCANSKIEAFMQFINILIDEDNYYYEDFDIKLILTEYYGLDKNELIIEEDIDSDSLLSLNIAPWNNSVNIQNIKSFQHLKKIKMSFYDKMCEKDPKFLITMYNKEWMNIDIRKYVPNFNITFICIKRILNKIKNTDYKHIRRLLLF